MTKQFLCAIFCSCTQMVLTSTIILKNWFYSRYNTLLQISVVKRYLAQNYSIVSALWRFSDFLFSLFQASQNSERIKHFISNYNNQFVKHREPLHKFYCFKMMQRDWHLFENSFRAVHFYRLAQNMRKQPKW